MDRKTELYFPSLDQVQEHQLRKFPISIELPLNINSAERTHLHCTLSLKKLELVEQNRSSTRETMIQSLSLILNDNIILYWFPGQKYNILKLLNPDGTTCC